MWPKTSALRNDGVGGLDCLVLALVFVTLGAKTARLCERAERILARHTVVACLGLASCR